MSPHTSRVARASNSSQLFNRHPWSDGGTSRPRPENSIFLISVHCSVQSGWHRVPLRSEQPPAAVYCEFSREALLPCVALWSSAALTALLTKSLCESSFLSRLIAEFTFLSGICRCIPRFGAGVRARYGPSVTTRSRRYSCVFEGNTVLGDSKFTEAYTVYERGTVYVTLESTVEAFVLTVIVLVFFLVVAR